MYTHALQIQDKNKKRTKVDAVLSLEKHNHDLADQDPSGFWFRVWPKGRELRDRLVRKYVSTYLRTTEKVVRDGVPQQAVREIQSGTFRQQISSSHDARFHLRQ